MDVIHIGPLALPAGLLLAFGALFAGVAIGNRAARASGIRVEPLLWAVAGAGLAVARIAFVLRYRDLYAGNPLAMLDMRDRGFDIPIGAAVAVLTAIWLAWRDPARRRPLAAGVGAAAAVALAGWLIAAALPARTLALPALTLEAFDGRAVALQRFAGKPLVINLWASWCPPCRREMPVLMRAQRGRPDVTFVFANQGETAATVRAYLAAQHITLDNMLLDPRTQLGAMAGSHALPTTLFFSADGKLVERHLGELSAATLTQGLEAAGAARKIP